MSIYRVYVLWLLWTVLVGQVSAQVPPVRHDLSESPCSGTEAIAFSPDGKLLASYRNSGMLRLWNTATGELLARVDFDSDLEGYVTNRGMVFSPDGKTLAAGVWSGVHTTGHIVLWDVEAQTLEQRTILKNDQGVLALAYTPDGNTLLSVSGEKGDRPREVQFWDVVTGKIRTVLPGRALALSADGRLLVTGTRDEVKVWDLKAEKERASWKVVNLNNLALSPDGKVLAASSFPKGGITFWDVASGERRNDMKPLLDAMAPMAFSPDGKRFVAVNNNRRIRPPSVRVTDVATGQVLAKFGHRGQHVSVAAWSPDGKLLASGGYDELAGAQLILRDVSDLVDR